MILHKLKNKKGFSLVEVLVGSSIICLSLILIVNLEAGISKIGLSSTGRVQAGMLAEEGVTAIQNIRNSSWQNISSLNNGVEYGLVWNDTLNSWVSTTTISSIDNNFVRTFTLSEVRRDAVSFDIVTSGGVIDLGTRKFTVNISWNSGFGTSTKTMTSYIYNIYNN